MEKQDDPLFYFVHLGYEKYNKKDGSSIVDAIKEQAKEENMEHVILKYEEVING